MYLRFLNQYARRARHGSMLEQQSERSPLHCCCGKNCHANLLVIMGPCCGLMSLIACNKSDTSPRTTFSCKQNEILSKRIVIIVCQENMCRRAPIFIKIMGAGAHMRSLLIHDAHANTHNSQLNTCNELSLNTSMHEQYDM